MDGKEAKEIIKEEMGERGVRWLHSKYSVRIFALISFAESVFLPIIVDPFLVALIISKRELWLRYTIIAIVFSILGGVAGYFVGLLFYDLIGQQLIEFYGLNDYFAEVSSQIDANAFVFVLLGALTPIPYKLVAIAAGVSKVNLLTFLAASIVGRILRLGMVGWATYLVGPKAVPLIRRHLLTMAYVIAIVLILYIILQFFFPELTQAVFAFVS